MPLRFDNRWIRELPDDSLTGTQPRQVHGALWSAVQPTPVARPSLLAWSPTQAERLGLEAELGAADPGLTAVLAGNALLPGMQPWASNYGGHQFGHWAGQLGDGRAISLGEAISASGERVELQLKGAGRTPYSRHADGRAVLRSSLREFICSEAMASLGIPSTGALSLVGSGETVVRDMFYDGRPQAEPGAIVCRVAPSFIRFGHFELPASRGEHDLLRQLVDFCIERDFAQLTGPLDQRRGDWFMAVCARTAELIAQWMRVGFVHGVMNTDNLSILGLTIDYGPYGWLEEVDPLWTPNTTDANGRRYCYARQPLIGEWNLACLAQALEGHVLPRDTLEAGLALYRSHYALCHQAHVRAKLGLCSEQADAASLWRGWFALLEQARLDYTLAHRWLMTALAEIEVDASAAISYDAAAWSRSRQDLQQWLANYARLFPHADADAARRRRMAGANPRYVPRNYLAQLAIDAATAGDLAPLRDLQAVLARPYDLHPLDAHHAAPRPEWARHRAGCSMLSCSS